MSRINEPCSQRKIRRSFEMVPCMFWGWGCARLYASSETSDISSAVATGSTLDFSNLAYYPLYLSLDVCILSIENQISLFLLFAPTVHTTYDLPPELPYSLLFMVLPCARALSPQGGWKAGRKTIGIGSRSKACCWSVVAYY